MAFQWSDENMGCIATYNILEGDKLLNQFDRVFLPFDKAGDTLLSSLPYFPKFGAAADDIEGGRRRWRDSEADDSVDTRRVCATLIAEHRRVGACCVGAFKEMKPPDGRMTTCQLSQVALKATIRSIRTAASMTCNCRTVCTAAAKARFFGIGDTQ